MGKKTRLPSPVVEITDKSVEGVRRGLEWLKRTEGRKGGHGTDINQADDIGCSAMVGLALLADGSTPSQGPLTKCILRRIVSYLIGCVERDAQWQHHFEDRDPTAEQDRTTGSHILRASVPQSGLRRSGHPSENTPGRSETRRNRCRCAEFSRRLGATVLGPDARYGNGIGQVCDHPILPDSLLAVHRRRRLST